MAAERQADHVCAQQVPGATLPFGLRQFAVRVDLDQEAREECMARAERLHGTVESVRAERTFATQARKSRRLGHEASRLVIGSLGGIAPPPSSRALPALTSPHSACFGVEQP